MSYSSNFTIRCTAFLSVELNDVLVQVMWTDPYLQIINMTTGGISVGNRLYNNMFMNTNTYSLDLNFNNLQVSQVGRYTCGIPFNEKNIETFIITRQYIVSVQG